MEFRILEILALILIALTVIKIVVYLISPQIWFGWVGRIYVKPELTSILGMILTVLVLYLILSAGVTFVEILSIGLLIALLITTAIGYYINDIIHWAENQDFLEVMKKAWFYSLVWIGLLMGGIWEIFFK